MQEMALTPRHAISPDIPDGDSNDDDDNALICIYIGIRRIYLWRRNKSFIGKKLSTQPFVLNLNVHVIHLSLCIAGYWAVYWKFKQVE